MKSALAFSVVLFGGCGSDPVSYSMPVGIELRAKSTEVANAAVTEMKDITTETGNPYGAFISDATAKLGGKAPTRIEIDSLRLTLGAQSTGVSALEQVMTGDVDVAFIVNTSNNTYDAGHVMNPTGVGPVAMAPNFEWSAVSADDQTRMLTGAFKVVVRGPAAADFAGKGATASLETTFTFTAF